LRSRPTRIAAAGDALGNAGGVKGLDGLAGEAVVASDGVRDEGLDARVAYVLKLFVVGRVHVGFMGVVAGGAPTDIPDFGQVGVRGIEGGEFLEWVGSELRGQGFEGDGGVGSGDVQVEIAPCAPPEWFECSMLAAVGEEAVGQAQSLAVGDLVAVALVLFLIIEGFGVGENDFGAFSAGDGELRVGGGQGFAVEEDVDVATCGDRYSRTRKGLKRLDADGGQWK